MEPIVGTLDSVWADSRGFGCVGHLHGAMQTTIGYCDTVSSISPDESHVLVSQYGYFSLDALRKKGVRSGQALYISISVAFNEVEGRIGGPELSYFDPEHEETRWATTGPKSNAIEVRMP